MPNPLHEATDEPDPVDGRNVTARATSLDRRTFLKGAVAGGAVLGGAAWLGACSSSPDASKTVTTAARATTTTTRTRPTALLDIPATSSPVDHVVVLMQENRSFDHWLGWLATDEAHSEAGRRRYGRDFAVTGDVAQRFAGPNGDVATAPLVGAKDQTNPYRGCGFGDPGHSWDDGRAQRDDGFLSPDSGNDTFALGYYQRADLPYSARFASRFTVCDHSFASLLGPTFPNRMYLHSAQSGGRKNNALPTNEGLGWDTIWDRLAKAGVDAAYYASDLPVTLLWGGRLSPITKKVDEYFEACEAGKLPAVTFLDPSFIGAMRTDNHPLADIRAGERFARDAFAAFATSPQWRSGVFISTYDEWGGFFDHVAPPILADDRSSPDDAANFAQAGFRVPTIVASPYSRPGSVDHTVYDHTSILRFIEWRFLGAPPRGPGGSKDWSLTKRDRSANNIGASMVETPTVDIGFDLDVKIPAPSAGCAGENYSGIAWSGPTSRIVPAVQPVVASSEPSSFEAIAQSELFQRLGVEVGPSAMAARWAGATAI